MPKPKQLRITLANKDTVTEPLADAYVSWYVAHTGTLILCGADDRPLKAYAPGTWLVAEVVS